MRSDRARLRNVNDLLSGIFLIAVALLALWFTRHLSTGTATSMGPGYVPRLLCLIQIAFGIGAILQAFFGRGALADSWALRPLVAVLAGVALFAVTFDAYGVVVAVIGLVVVSTFGCRETSWKEAIALSIFMAAFAVLVFVKGLELPVTVWPSLGG